MANVTYIKNTKHFQNKQLPKIISKYNLSALPFGKFGEKYVGNGLDIIIDKREVRIHVYKRGLDFNIKDY